MLKKENKHTNQSDECISRQRKTGRLYAMDI